MASQNGTSSFDMMCDGFSEWYVPTRGPQENLSAQIFHPSANPDDRATPSIASAKRFRLL